MTDREVWIVASGLLAEFGSHPGEHTIEQMMEFPGAPQTIADWHRVSAALDALVGGGDGRAN
jgi:hypothetical protein